jgi:hypothetical protein
MINYIHNHGFRNGVLHSPPPSKGTPSLVFFNLNNTCHAFIFQLLQHYLPFSSQYGPHSDSGISEHAYNKYQTTCILKNNFMHKYFIVVHNSRGNIHINTILIYAFHGSASIWLSHLLDSLFSLDIPIVLMIPTSM